MIRPTVALALTIGLLGLGAAPAARGGIITYAAVLDGASESPPNASPGTGFAQVDIDDVALTMRVRVTFSGLLGTTTAAHIHAPTATPGTGTASVATQVPTFVDFPLGVTSGTYDGTLDLADPSAYNPAFITNNGGTVEGARAALLADLAAGTAYLNVHSTFATGGEIRGFLRVVPEPSGLVLAAVGGACMLAAARRRR
jgi:hypothetical protein